MNYQKKFWVTDPINAYNLAEAKDIGNDERANIRVRVVGNGEEREVTANERFLVDEGSLVGIENLLQLSHLNEANFLMNLSTRYTTKQIYTSIGSTIMISVNPFQNLPFYDIATYEKTQNQPNKSSHLFSFAHDSLQNIERYQKNQSIIISGESGSGKTEAMKILLGYVSHEECKRQAAKAIGKSKQRNVQEQIVDNNQILESFGNAKTVRNNNSSRFGKFIKVYIRQSDQQVQKAVVQSYLLEKSRVTHIAQNERNYHIFYQMIRGGDSEFKKKFLLGELDDYQLLRNGDNQSEMGDEKNFKQLLKCLRVMNFSDESIDSIFAIASGILCLGNVTIKQESDTESFISNDDQYLQKAATLLKVSVNELRTLICTPTILDPSSKQLIEVHQTVVQARYSIEGLCKALYGKLFDWIVEEINHALNEESEMFINEIDNEEGMKEPTGNNKNLGILDIFGFEIFEQNSFEQLCINFANEKLQFSFSESVLHLEQLEYQSEGIYWQGVIFQDNKETIELLEAKGLSLFGFLEDECKRQDGNDQRFVNQIQTKLNRSPSLLPLKQNLINVKKLFKIKHFAGDVEYDSTGFIEKNRDQTSSALLKLLGTSENLIIKEKFSAENLKKQTAISIQFKASLQVLLAELKVSTNFYVKCIKPNRKAVANSFDHTEVQRQIRCAGLLEAIKVRKAGYAMRVTQEEFSSRYACLVGKKELQQAKGVVKQKCEMIIVCALRNQRLEDDCFAIGKTKVFLRESFRELMEKRLRDVWGSKAVVISKNLKMLKEMQLFKLKKHSVNQIQRVWRKWNEKRKEILRRELLRKQKEEEERQRKLEQERVWRLKQEEELRRQQEEQSQYLAQVNGELDSKNRQALLQDCFVQAEQIQKDRMLQSFSKDYATNMQQGDGRSSFFSTIEDTIRVKGNAIFESRSPGGMVEEEEEENRASDSSLSFIAAGYDKNVQSPYARGGGGYHGAGAQGGFSQINDRSEILPNGILSGQKEIEIMDILRQKSLVLVNPQKSSISMYEYLKKSTNVNEFLQIMQMQIEVYLQDITKLNTQLDEKSEVYAKIENSLQARLDKAIYANVVQADKDRIQIQELREANEKLEKALAESNRNVEINKSFMQSNDQLSGTQKNYGSIDSELRALRDKVREDESKISALRSLADQQRMDISKHEQQRIQYENQIGNLSRQLKKLHQKDQFNEDAMSFLRTNIDDFQEEIKIYRDILRNHMNLLPDQTVINRLAARQQASQKALRELEEKYFPSR